MPALRRYDAPARMANLLPLEDELGDVLDKALRNAGLNETQLAAATGIDASRIKDAIDYRYEFTCVELQKLASALGLNEVGVCALGENKYPLPRLPVLPFALHVITLPYGAGRVNAFAAVHPRSGAAVLFDTGNAPEALSAFWPPGVPAPTAVFVTHWDRDHAAGLPAALDCQPAPIVHGPSPCSCCPVVTVGEGDLREIGGFFVRTYRTPGHTAEHNAYFLALEPGGRGVLCSGDLLFAGSLGGAFFCCRTLLREARRIIDSLPGTTIIAPGHGPLTTIENERRFNPFLG